MASAKHFIGLMGLAFTSAALAQGQVIIDQNSAINGYVTPGDAPGFPVTLSFGGSYQLGSGISSLGSQLVFHITTDNVTLDLNGFTVTGPGGTTCTPYTNTGYGNSCTVATVTPVIRVTGKFVTIKNGFVSGNFYGGGIAFGPLGFDGTLQDLTAPLHSLLVNVTANWNNGYGVHLQSGVIENLVARDNGNTGLFMDNGSVSRALVSANNATGVYVGSGNVNSLHTSRNAGAGFQMISGIVLESTAQLNQGVGFQLDPATACYAHLGAFNNTGGAVSGGKAMTGTTTVCP